MDPNRLSAKQKKVKKFEEALLTPSDNRMLKSRLQGLINDYKSALYQVWKSPHTVSDHEIFTLERELDEAHEELRLSSHPRM